MGASDKFMADMISIENSLFINSLRIAEACEKYIEATNRMKEAKKTTPPHESAFGIAGEMREAIVEIEDAISGRRKIERALAEAFFGPTGEAGWGTT